MPTILVVDDFASVRLYHTAFLKQKGYRCLEAADGLAALEQLAANTVDLVLLDLLMPSLDGAEFVRRARELPSNRELPILAITSESLCQESQELKARYGVSLLQKPVLPDALLSQVQAALSSRQNQNAGND